jgi:hypothetical protein
MRDETDRLTGPGPDDLPADRSEERDDEADDIAAFYAAQEVGFACLRERYEARRRRKLEPSDLRS